MTVGRAACVRESAPDDKNKNAKVAERSSTGKHPSRDRVAGCFGRPSEIFSDISSLKKRRSEQGLPPPSDTTQNYKYIHHKSHSRIFNPTNCFAIMDSGLWTVRHRVAVVAIIQGRVRGTHGEGDPRGGGAKGGGATGIGGSGEQQRCGGRGRVTRVGLGGRDEGEGG